jgi:hypothetical protein
MLLVVTPTQDGSSSDCANTKTQVLLPRWNFFAAGTQKKLGSEKERKKKLTAITKAPTTKTDGHTIS